MIFSNKINSHLILTLISFSVLITPIVNFYEIKGLFDLVVEHSGFLLSSLIYKASKEILIILILFLTILVSFKYNKKYSYFFYICLFTLSFHLLISIIVVDVQDNIILYLLSGIRWSLFFFLILFFYLFHKNFYRYYPINISPIVIIFFINFLFQVIQFFSGGNFYGATENNYGLRSPGIFFIPSTTGFFVVVSTFIVVFLSNFNNSQIILFICFAFISSFLTMSGTAVVSLLLIAIGWLLRKFSFLSLIISLILMLTISIFLLGTLTGRGDDYLRISMGIRFEIFIDLFINALLFSDKFGYGTSAAYLLGLDGVVTDSFFSTVLVNFGLIGFFIIFSIIIYLIINTLIYKNIVGFIFIVICFFYFLTISVSEAYPMNIIVAFIAGYLFVDKSRVIN